MTYRRIELSLSPAEYHQLVNFAAASAGEYEMLTAAERANRLHLKQALPVLLRLVSHKETLDMAPAAV